MIILLVALLVAFGVAEEYCEQLYIRRLRQIYLPLTWRPQARTREAILRWLAVLCLVVTEFLMSVVEPIVPFGIILLLITQGCDAASALLNGLAMGFVLQIDNLVPVIVLGPREVQRMTAELTALVSKGSIEKHARGMYGFHHTVAWRSVTMVILSFGTQVIVFFNEMPYLICEMLIHHLHYRATIRIGVWIVGSCHYFVEVVGRIYFWETGVSVHDTRADHVLLGSKGLWYVAREVGFAAEHFSYMLLAAFTLNVTYWYSTNVLYYAMPLKDSYELYFDDFVWDLFGTCGKGYYFNECLDQGPPGWDGLYAP